MKLKTVKIKDLIQHSQNPNTHPKEQIDELQDSLKQFDQVKNIVVWKGQVIAGNGLLAAAQKQGREKIQVQDVSDWPEEKALKFMVADNRLADMAVMNDDLLSDLITGFDEPLDVPGIDEEFLSDLDLGGGLNGDNDKNPDEVPEDVEPIVKSGELWLLGNHRLLCGDATKREDVERLMNNKKIDFIFTDPPYGVDYSGGTKKQKRLSGDKTPALYQPFLELIKDYSEKHLALYLFYADGDVAVTAAVTAAGYKVRNNIIWNKNQAQFGALSAQYKQKHEPFLYCHLKNQSPQWFGPKNETTVWDVDRSATNNFHPTQKPIDLIIRAINNSSQKDNLVLDGFLGSGSTLIACEKTNRICYGMEIDEHYCTIILQRWSDFTGKDPVREDEVKFSKLKNK